MPKACSIYHEITTLGGYNSLGRLTEALYGENTDLSSNPNRYTERVLEYTANGNVRRFQRHIIRRFSPPHPHEYSLPAAHRPTFRLKVCISDGNSLTCRRKQQTRNAYDKESSHIP